MNPMVATYTDATWGEVNKTGTIVLFYEATQQNAKKTEEEGRPIFESIVKIKKITPGDRSMEIDRKAFAKDFEDFPAQYEQFKAKKSNSITGTPIEQWPQITTTQAAELKALNVFTVEQLASLPDSVGTKFMGFNSLRLKASKFLSASADMEKVEQIKAEREKFEAELAVEREARLALEARLAALEGGEVKPKRKYVRKNGLVNADAGADSSQ